MRFPNYDDCSLQELYKFIADRHIPIKFTRAQAHTKTLYKRDKEERRKLTATLDKADAATTNPFMEFPPELRDQIYDYILTDMTTTEMMDILTKTEIHERMRRVSTQFWVEARGVLNIGDYNTIPELVDLPARSTTLVPKTRGVVVPQDDGSGGFLTPAPATENVAVDSMTPKNIGSVIRRSLFSTIGPAGQGKSSLVSSPQSVSQYRTIPSEDRWQQVVFRRREAMYAAHRQYALPLYTARDRFVY
jgi:hypothetical protein